MSKAVRIKASKRRPHPRTSLSPKAMKTLYHLCAGVMSKDVVDKLAEVTHPAAAGQTENGGAA